MIYYFIPKKINLHKIAQQRIFAPLTRYRADSFDTLFVK